jgi:phage anti-repressor protein
MDTSLNYVALVQSNPAPLLNEYYNNKYMQQIKDSFTESQQQLYIASLSCLINYHPTNDYVIDLDNVWHWLGFSQKYAAKRMLETHFISNQDYKCGLTPSDEYKHEGRGGHNRETIILNVRTFKRLCLKANTQKAEEIHEYYIRIEEIHQLLVLEQAKEVKRQLEERDRIIEDREQELERKDEELRIMESCRVTPIIYVYNTNINDIGTPLLKIGYSDCLTKRVNPYRQGYPYGKMIYHHSIDIDAKINEFEALIHKKLAKFKVHGELFRIEEHHAITCILGEYYMYKAFQTPIYSTRNELLKKLHQLVVSSDQPDTLRNLYTSRDSNPNTEPAPDTLPEPVAEPPEDEPDTPPMDNPSPESSTDLNACFEKFIQDHCIVRPDVEVSAKDIVGQYRLVARQAKKEVTKAFTEYLNTGYVYGRLKHQDKDQVVMGYRGVMLKNLVYNKGLILCDEETFVFEKCIFTPSGTALYKNIWEEYLDWKRIMKKPVNDADDAKKLKKYLKTSPYVLFETVWANGTSGQGFYGLKLKRDEKYHRKSTTGAVILKKDNRGQVLCEFDTIAKAAVEEGMCAPRMSRSIRDKTIFKLNDTDTYYYCKKAEAGLTT